MVKDDCYYEAKTKFDVYPSAVANNWVASCRNKKGLVRKTKAGLSLKRWNKEKWTDQKGRRCGSGKGETVKCRPSKKVSKKTPVTWKEMSNREKRKAVSEKKKVGMGKKASPIRRKTSPKGSLEEFKRRKENKLLYKPFPSSLKSKKYSVYVKSESGNKKLIHFGQKGYQHYHDKIGYYSSKNHEDKERRRRYRIRHKGEDKDKNKPGWWAWHKLW